MAMPGAGWSHLHGADLAGNTHTEHITPGVLSASEQGVRGHRCDSLLCDPKVGKKTKKIQTLPPELLTEYKQAANLINQWDSTYHLQMGKSQHLHEPRVDGINVSDLQQQVHGDDDAGPASATVLIA